MRANFVFLFHLVVLVQLVVNGRYGFSFRNVELSSIHSSVSKSYLISPIPPQRDKKLIFF